MAEASRSRRRGDVMVTITQSPPRQVVSRRIAHAVRLVTYQ